MFKSGTLNILYSRSGCGCVGAFEFRPGFIGCAQAFGLRVFRLSSFASCAAGPRIKLRMRGRYRSARLSFEVYPLAGCPFAKQATGIERSVRSTAKAPQIAEPLPCPPHSFFSFTRPAIIAAPRITHTAARPISSSFDPMGRGPRSLGVSSPPLGWFSSYMSVTDWNRLSM